MRVSVVAFSLAALVTGCLLEPDPSIEVVDSVDLTRYAGKYFEIASIPSIASANGRCVNTTAEYTLQADGTIRLSNECFLNNPDGRRLFIAGRARALDETNARLAILFDSSLMEEAYNIIDLDPDYQWAVVGSGPDGLFILSRTPTLDDQIFAAIVSRLPDLGYDPDRLLLTPQISE
jgi:apolipoprotein D and lipocalin family protein